ncbi:hypothetical protein J27TS8_03380 [Robertmurraya siralis]|uniref:Uncharacterized protein n=1 Tax=Robertmurraya siralis TaxID=77777 RepID=A0A919WE93_9BACI|nr:hypothetical protein J27TS8_03380 [Robertmurraya siralis]
MSQKSSLSYPHDLLSCAIMAIAYQINQVFGNIYMKDSMGPSVNESSVLKNGDYSDEKSKKRASGSKICYIYFRIINYVFRSCIID